MIMINEINDKKKNKKKHRINIIYLVLQFSHREHILN